jgi:hypothetical protein
MTEEISICHSTTTKASVTLEDMKSLKFIFQCSVLKNMMKRKVIDTMCQILGKFKEWKCPDTLST